MIGCQVPVYAQDVSFCAFNWPKGELCGTKQTVRTMGMDQGPMGMVSFGELYVW